MILDWKIIIIIIISSGGGGGVKDRELDYKRNKTPFYFKSEKIWKETKKVYMGFMKKRVLLVLK